MRAYLLGGGDFFKEAVARIYKKIFLEKKNPVVVVIPWSSRDENKLVKYRTLITKSFNRFGVSKLFFFDLAESLEEMRNRIHAADIVFLPGGDTQILLENIKKVGLVDILKTFNGVIVGTSAGAYVLTNLHLDLRHKKIEKMMELIPLSIKCHFKDELRKDIQDIIDSNAFYGIPDDGYIIWETNLGIVELGGGAKLVQ